MYCMKCGVKLADSEKHCPLCATAAYHPDLPRPEAKPLYPYNKMPEISSGHRTLSGAVVLLFLMPLMVCFIADYYPDQTVEWFGFVAGAIGLAYTALALPMWFRKPNPVILVPCNFLTVLLYLLYINFATGGDWFLQFAFPVTGGLCLITCAVVALLFYLSKGRLYIFGGAFIALGALALLMEFLMGITFQLQFIGWSLYPLVVLILFGGLLIYLAIHRSAREVMKRKLFF